MKRRLTATILFLLILPTIGHTKENDILSPSALYYLIDNLMEKEGILYFKHVKKFNKKLGLLERIEMKQHPTFEKVSQNVYKYEKKINSWFGSDDFKKNPCNHLDFVKNSILYRNLGGDPMIFGKGAWPYNGDYGSLANLSRSVAKETLECINYDKHTNSPEIPLWTYDIKKHSQLKNATELLAKKIIEIENRLISLHENKKNLQIKYSGDFDSKNIDNDIKYINELGLKLVKPTKRFFDLAKQQMKKIDEANARTEGLQGLNTFIEQIQIAVNQPTDALEKTVVDITDAIDQLERAINE